MNGIAVRSHTPRPCELDTLDHRIGRVQLKLGPHVAPIGEAKSSTRPGGSARPAISGPPALPDTVDGLAPGQIVFCARPSLIQGFSRLVDDEWRHAGVVVETDDGLFVSGFGRKDKYALMPIANLSRYSRVAVGSVFRSAAEVEQAQRWISQFEGRQAAYPESSIIVAWFMSLARAVPSVSLRRLITALCTWYCLMLANRYRDEVAFICSTFVISAVNAAREQPLSIAMLARKSDDNSDRCRKPTTEVLLARWLATPSDIWRAIPSADRRDLVVA